MEGVRVCRAGEKLKFKEQACQVPSSSYYYRLPLIFEFESSAHIIMAVHTLKSKLSTVPKVKRITKAKTQRKSSMLELQEKEAETDISENSTSLESISPRFPKRQVYLFLRELVQLNGYHQDTYLSCLTVLERLGSVSLWGNVRLLAGVILLVVGKLHEYKPPKLSILSMWGGRDFHMRDLLLAEEHLLVALNFAVPVLSHLESLEEFEEQTLKMELIFNHEEFPFQ